MSTTMHLFRVVDAQYTQRPESEEPVTHTWNEIRDLPDDERDRIFKEDDEAMERFWASEWSDGIKHDMIPLSDLKWFAKRGFKISTAKRLKKFKHYQMKLKNKLVNYIPVDEVVYAQGWFFTHGFFNRKISWVYCTTKEEMRSFAKKWLRADKYNKKYGGNFETDFVDKMVEGEMIFEAAF